MNSKQKIILAAITMIFTSLFFGHSTFADVQSSVLQKALLQGLYRCYTGGAINTNAGKLSNFHRFDKLITGGKSGTYITLPNGLTNIEDNNISCKGLFMGDEKGIGTESGTFDGLFKIFGKSQYAGTITDDNKKTTLLEGMGYSAPSSSNKKSCVYYIYDNTDPSSVKSYTQKVCVSGDSLSVEENNIDCGNDSSICLAPIYFEVEKGKTLVVRDGLWKNEKKISYSGDWNKFREKLNSEMSSTFRNPENGDAFEYTFNAEKSANTQDSSGDNTYKIVGKKSSAAVRAIQFLQPSYKKHADIKFNDQEKLWYYTNTIGAWFFEGKEANKYYKCGISENPSLYGNYAIINVDPSTKAKNKEGDCGVDKDAIVNSGGIYSFNKDNYFSADGKVMLANLDTVIAEINRLAGNMSDEEMLEIQESGEKPEKIDKDCFDAGIDSMAWILCPLNENTMSTVNGLDQEMRNWLQIKTDNVFKQEVETGWEVFRNIANVALIIIFLIIIFSQLTGVGIDNYGIKKILPKLIITAVLINLSYIMCKLAVDLSNILGTGLDDLFRNIGVRINKGNANLTIEAIFDAVMGLIGAGGAIAGIAIASGGGVMVIISLLLALLVALVSVLMIFVMLGARMIIVIVFTMISPVAFALYILPNTQSLFKKWWKVFQAALVVFPICGALYGASYIIKAVVGDAGFLEGIIAIIAPFLPFLLIPTLLKNALAGLGMIGGTLTMLGNGLKKGAKSGKSAIEGTKAYKGVQERAADRSAERRATRIRNRLQRAADRRGGVENLNSSQRRRLYQAQTLINEHTQQRAQERAGVIDLSSPEGVAIAQSRADAAREAQEYKAFQDQFADPTFNLQNEANTATQWYNPEDRVSRQRMRALVGAMEGRGMEAQIYNMLRSNNVSSDAATMNALNNSSNKVLKAYGKRGGAVGGNPGVSFKDFMNGTGEHSMQGYIQSKGADFLDGLDDKALAEIARYGNGQAMDTELLAQAGAKINNAESLEHVNAMLRNRDNIAISGAQLADYNAGTLAAIQTQGGSNIDAILAASDDIASDPKLIGKLDPNTREMINILRERSGKNRI